MEQTIFQKLSHKQKRLDQLRHSLYKLPNKLQKEIDKINKRFWAIEEDIQSLWEFHRKEKTNGTNRRNK